MDEGGRRRAQRHHHPGRRLLHRHRPAGRHPPARLGPGPATAGRGVCKTVGLMEYVILIIVIAVLAVAAGGWLLFVRPRRGRITQVPAGPAPEVQPPTTGTGPAPAATAPPAQSAEAPTPAAPAARLETE